MPRLASDKYCTGCLACYDTCNHQAIQITHKNELTYVKVDPQKCIECKLCESSCPIITPVEKNQVQNMKIYGGWCKQDKYRIKGASGGAFTAIALSFLTQFEKAVVVGASLQNNRVKHIAIENSDDIELLTNSKYIQSETQGIYRQIKQKLKNNYHVLFSGTPCQIAALYAFLGKNKYNTLYTIELVCHGIPSHEALDLHLKYYKSSKIYSFRDKKEGQYWFASQRTTIDINGEPVKIQRNKDIFYRIFSSWLLDRKSCSNCKFSCINRVADITLADFWGAPCDEQEFLKGVSLIISNNDHGDYLIHASSSFLHLFNANIKDAINSNPNLYTGYKYIQYHPLVMFPDFFRKLLPEKLRLSILTNRMPWKFLWAIYKILTILHTKRIKKRIINTYLK